MNDDIMDKVMRRYGVFGALVVIFAVFCVLFFWVIMTIMYPILFLLPILLAIWMVWSVSNYKPKNKPPKKLSEDTIRAAQLAGSWGDVEFNKHGIKEGSPEATIYALARLDAVKLIRGEEDESESS